MYIFAFLDFMRCDADFFAVFGDLFVYMNVLYGNLVSVGDIADDSDKLLVAALVTDLNFRAVLDSVCEDRGDIVEVVDF